MAFYTYFISICLLSFVAAKFDIEQRLQELEAGFQDLADENQLLKEKIADLENKLEESQVSDGNDRAKSKFSFVLFERCTLNQMCGPRRFRIRYISSKCKRNNCRHFKRSINII